MKKFFIKLKEVWLGILFPKKCVFCGRLLSPTAESEVCYECMNNLPFCLAYNRCKKCGKPIGGEEKECGRCRMEKIRYYTKISAAYLYKDDVKKSILKFKNEKYSYYGRTYAEHIKIVVENDNKNRDFDVVIAVAPRSARMKKSGYDQAECLAENLAKLMNLPFKPEVLKQKEARKRQSSLSADERRENARGNYIVKRKDEIFGKRVLLVDDVCTTGATLTECAKVLKEAGAAQVCCAVAARVG